MDKNGLENHFFGSVEVFTPFCTFRPSALSMQLEKEDNI